MSVSWLTFWQILGIYWYISCSWWYIFLKFFGDNLRMFVHFFKIIKNFMHVCQSISWLIYMMKLGQYRDISCPGWDIFLKLFGNIPGIFLHYFKINANCFYAFQSVSWLTSLHILDKCRHIFCSVWYIFLKYVWHISGMFVDYFFHIIWNFLYAFQSVSWLTSILKLGKYKDISSSDGDVILEVFGNIPGMFVH